MYCLEVDNVKSFNLMGPKCAGLTMTDIFLDTCIRGFQIILNINKVKKYMYFIGILNSWIVLPTKYMKYMKCPTNKNHFTGIDFQQSFRGEILRV